jgi:hypothetical protein
MILTRPKGSMSPGNKERLLEHLLVLLTLQLPIGIGRETFCIFRRDIARVVDSIILTERQGVFSCLTSNWLRLAFLLILMN